MAKILTTYRVCGHGFHPRFRNGEFIQTDASEPLEDGAEVVVVSKDGSARLATAGQSFAEAASVSVVVARLRAPITAGPVVEVNARG